MLQMVSSSVCVSRTGFASSQQNVLLKKKKVVENILTKERRRNNSSSFELQRRELGAGWEVVVQPLLAGMRPADPRRHPALIQQHPLRNLQEPCGVEMASFAPFAFYTDQCKS